jgi:hypothetical protein
MRRCFLVLTVISFAGWSQPQQPQPPIVVQIQTPPANPWMRLVELVIPGIIGAGLALLGVWYTNKNNAVTNAANRQHDLEKLNREHTFGLKRDVLMRLTQLFVQERNAVAEWRFQMEVANATTMPNAFLLNENEEQRKDIVEQIGRSELDQATAAACLAISDDLWQSAQGVRRSLFEAVSELVHQGTLANSNNNYTKTNAQLDEELFAFIQAARKELGIVHIDA